MTQLSLEAIRQQLTERHFHADKVKIVTVEAMDPADLESCTTVENETFYNSYMNVIYGKGDRYVLGYRCNEAEIIDQAIIVKVINTMIQHYKQIVIISNLINLLFLLNFKFSI